MRGDPFPVPSGAAFSAAPAGAAAVPHLSARPSAPDDGPAMPVFFTAGTHLATPRGPVPVGHAAPGCRVLTRDRGYQPLRFAVRQHMPPEATGRGGRRIVRIAAGALGPGLPARDLLLSPAHRLLLPSATAPVTADALAGRPGVTEEAPGAGFDPVSLLLDLPALLLAEGLWLEGPGAGAVAARPVVSLAEGAGLSGAGSLPQALVPASPGWPRFGNAGGLCSLPAAASDAEEARDLAFPKLAHRP